MSNNTYVPDTLIVLDSPADGWTSISYVKANKSRRMITAFNNQKVKEISNNFLSGFKIDKGDEEDSVIHCWSYDIETVALIDPRGFKFYLGATPFKYLVSNSIVENGTIVTPLKYSWNGKDMVLIPEGTILHKLADDYTALQYKKCIRVNHIKTGAMYRGKDDNEYVYMGMYRTSGYGHNWCAKNHVFYNIVQDSFSIKEKTTFVVEEIADSYSHFGSLITKLKANTSRYEVVVFDDEDKIEFIETSENAGYGDINKIDVLFYEDTYYQYDYSYSGHSYYDRKPNGYNLRDKLVIKEDDSVDFIRLKGDEAITISLTSGKKGQLVIKTKV